MKKIVLALALLLAIGLVFGTVCGPGHEEEEETPESENEETSSGSSSGSGSGSGGGHLWGASLTLNCVYDHNVTNSSGVYLFNSDNVSINFTVNPFGFEVCEVLG